MFTATHDRTYQPARRSLGEGGLASDTSSRQSSSVGDAARAAGLTAAYIAVAALLVSSAVWTAAAATSRADSGTTGVCAGLALAALAVWSVLPRPGRFDSPGVPILPAGEPALWRLVSEAASSTGRHEPAEIYLTGETGLSLAVRSGFAGFGGRRVLLVGLPLLDAVGVQELRALLAHEFAQDGRGAGAFDAWIHRTRAALARAMPLHPYAALSAFAWYRDLFLRATRGVERRQVTRGDAAAASAAGASSMIAALHKRHAASLAYRNYAQQELQPVVERGFLPPVLDGFRRFLEAPGMSDCLDAVTRCDAAFAETVPPDAQPSLSDRITALERLPQRVQSDTRRAASLLQDVHAREADVFEVVSSRTLQRIAWDQVAEAVYLPLWRARVDAYGHLLRGRTIGTLPVTGAEFISLGAAMFPRHEEPSSDSACIDRAGHLVLGAVAVRLWEQGWSVTALPGEETILRRNGVELHPYSQLRAILDGRAAPACWRQRCEALGIADVPVWGAPERQTPD